MDSRRFDNWENSVAWALKRAGLLLFVANVPELTTCVVEDFEWHIEGFNRTPKARRAQEVDEHVDESLDNREACDDLWFDEYVQAYRVAAHAVVDLEIDCDCHGGRRLVDIGGGDTEWEDCTCFRAGREG
jgi:hypothetical protein